MKVMLIEDNAKKLKSISEYLYKKGIDKGSLIIVKNMTDFAANLSSEIGLFIIDFYLPSFNNGDAAPNGRAILETIIKAGKNNALMLAISSYPQDFSGLREYYEAHGCVLLDYSKPDVWRSAIDHYLVQMKNDLRFDFILFCALQEERNPYVILSGGNNIIRGGVDCLDISIGEKKGAVVLLPRMGLVNAAITAAVCIDRYRPKIVGMSGICGGFPSRSELGQLLFSSMAYEYQSGKWASDGFRHEPYQVPTDHNLLTLLKLLSNQPNFIVELEKNFSGIRPSKQYKPEPGVFTSGSAVIANAELMKQIEQIHRKVNALDMEIFSIHQASEFSMHKPPCICAKVVVDLGDNNKNDDLHQYGSFISAKFLLESIKKYFEEFN